ncbi:class III extradiol ring-cleavage dioxygenase family protein [Sphaerimonospora thailandensis]|uniref:Catalytic LigB subunit of aromatic ring-opening dioxygenase n=1 Tax=Sphaerimonospora thailandensis TaxID=795644 RepID=A0A8J3R8D2_9ACTN|nr:hypothetical protein [Sphaerimonospora thailandensis]GIH67903.1 hypothetical protein Mth01_01560 [Sphaerimonospora thailandensis]
MIVAACCVPQTPLLLPGLTGGPVAEVEELRTAALAAAQTVVGQTLVGGGVNEIVVVGGAPRTGSYPADAPTPAGRLAPAPGRRPAPGSLPVPLAVGRSLLAGHPVLLTLQGVDEHASPRSCGELGHEIAARPGRIGLVVVGDGSARREEKAPGYVDPRALEADAAIGDALASADLPALAALNPGLCDDLLIRGRAAWQVLAAATESTSQTHGTSWTAHTLYGGAPFGVAYWSVTWLPHPTPQA